MPCLKILTNLPRAKIPNDFVNKILPLLAKVVRKPEDKFVCVVSGDCAISFGGQSTVPGAVATLESIGHLGVEDNKVITKEVSAFIEKELGIAPDLKHLLSIGFPKTGLSYTMTEAYLPSVGAGQLEAANHHARTNLLSKAPLTCALHALNDTAERIDIFTCSLNEFTKTIFFFLSFYDLEGKNVGKGGVTMA